MSLPTEIRLQIFEYLLQHHHYLYDGCNNDGIVIWPAILLTSRTIYEEASQILYEKNRFNYFLLADGYGRLWPFDKVLSPGNLYRIKHL